MSVSSDPYLYPGTDVLRNKAGIRDPVKLARFEANAAGHRLLELEERPTRGNFDVPHVKAVHKYIFQDIFPWAGEFRTVNISKGGHLFGMCAFIESALSELLARLPKENHLKGLDPTAFSARAGFYLSEINAIHPFREGNGRTQREFLRQLGAAAGYSLDWRNITRDQMTAASIESFLTGKSASMAQLIELTISARADSSSSSLAIRRSPPRLQAAGRGW